MCLSLGHLSVLLGPQFLSQYMIIRTMYSVHCTLCTIQLLYKVMPPPRSFSRSALVAAIIS